MSVTVRQARAGDGPALLDLIKALAVHQNEPHLVTATADELEAFLCTPAERHGCLVAERDGAVIGLAYWYEVFTTYAARPKLFLEDLCVLPQARGSGAGVALMAGLARLCVERGYPRFEWNAFNDNETGKRFYARCGGAIKAGVDTWHLAPADIRTLAEVT